MGSRSGCECRNAGTAYRISDTAYRIPRPASRTPDAAPVTAATRGSPRRRRGRPRGRPDSRRGRRRRGSRPRSSTAVICGTETVRNVSEKWLHVARAVAHGRRIAGRTSSACRRRSWRTDSSSVTCAPRPIRPESVFLPFVFGPARQIRDEVDAQTGRPLARTRAIEASAAVRSLGRTSDCRMPYGAITRPNCRPAETAARGCRRGRAAPGPRAVRASAGAARRASIGAERSMPTMRAPLRATGTQIRPVPQPNSSTGPSTGAGKPLPERDVASLRRFARSPSRRRRRTRPSPRQPSCGCAFVFAIREPRRDAANRYNSRAWVFQFGTGSAGGLRFSWLFSQDRPVQIHVYFRG